MNIDVWCTIKTTFVNESKNITTTKFHFEERDWFDFLVIGYSLPFIAEEHVRHPHPGDFSVNALDPRKIKEVHLLGFFRTKEEAQDCRLQYVEEKKMQATFQTQCVDGRTLSKEELLKLIQQPNQANISLRPESLEAALKKSNKNSN